MFSRIKSHILGQIRSSHPFYHILRDSISVKLAELLIFGIGEKGTEQILKIGGNVETCSSHFGDDRNEPMIQIFRLLLEKLQNMKEYENS